MPTCSVSVADGACSGSGNGSTPEAVQIFAWPRSDRDNPATALGLNSRFYGATAVCLYRRLTLLLHDWQNLSATLAQLRLGGFSRFSLSETHYPFLTMKCILS
jgi:hypothetical protein